MSLEPTARDSSSGGRPHLLSFWELAVFTAAVLMALTAAFINQGLVVKSEQERLGDPLSVAYLANLLRTEPDNLGVRARLAENEIYLGQLADVPQVIDPLLRNRDPQGRAEGQLLKYKYLTKRYLLSDDGDPGRPKLMKLRREMLAQLAMHSLSPLATAYLADQASTLREHKIAVRLYRRLTRSPDASPAWCASMAVRALGDRDYEMAAFLYFTARHKEKTLAGQREYLIAGIRALMADSLFAEAMRAADEHLGNLRNDPETLRFLVKTARAANDPERAARYVRQLLQVSWLDRAYRWWERLDLGFVASAEAAPLAPNSGKPKMGHYDAQKYNLAYDVFLESHNLSDAFAVAEAGVRNSPEDASWHQRLAKVAEWTGKPRIALREWLWLMRHEQEGDTALLAVLRIAPQLDDYDSALEAWKYMAARRPLTDEQWRTMAGLFEKAGRPGEGVKYLEAQYEQKHIPVLLELAAGISQRSGGDRHAQILYLRLLKFHGFKSEWVQNVANLYLDRGEYRKAYNLLQKNIRHVGKKDVAYRKMLAGLAWQLQDDASAAKQYQELARNQSLPKEDFSRLLELLGNTKQEEAARLAESAYQKYGDSAMLLHALRIYAARHDLVAEKRLLDEADADGKPGVLGDPHFIVARAQFLQAIGAFPAAHAAYLHAAALAPDDPQVVNDVLWGLIEAHDQAGLRALVLQINARGDQRNPAYWGALAGAYDVLDQPAREVAYYQRNIRARRNDFLWLVNYADALERNRQYRTAWRVRRYAWAQLRKKLGEKPLTLPFSPDMLAAAQLQVINQPGDPSLSLVSSVLRQDRLAKRDFAPDAQLSELVLGWALSTEQTFGAKAWLWQRYGRDLQRPVWADATIAGANHDTARLGRLLEEQPDAMPAGVRHDAATALGLTGDAQSIAFETLKSDPDNAQAYENFASDVRDAANRAGFEIRRKKLGTLQQSIQELTLDTALTDTFRVGLALQHMSQSDSDQPTLTPFPSTQRLAGVSVENRTSLGKTLLRLRRVDEFAGFNEVQLSQTITAQPTLTLKVGGERHAEADESNDLLVYGMRDAVSGEVDYDFPSRAFLSVQPRYARYYTQKGATLGTGGVLSWEVGRHVSTRFPDLRVSVMGINEAFSTAQNAPFALPRNQSLYGGCFGFAGNDQQTYSRAWHPYFDACGTSNTAYGRGYIAKAGLAGPVAGHDRLNLSFDQEQGGTRVPNGIQRVLTCSYQYLFD